MQYASCMEMAPESWPTRPDYRLRTTTLRERKRRRTRRALIEAAVDLFDRQGYDQTTVAEIAAGAQVSPRSFFSYFGSKEEILFPDSDSRVQVAADAIAARAPGLGPLEVLVDVLQRVVAVDTAMASRMARVRMRLIMEVPAVRGRCLQVSFSAQREIARLLHAAFPDELDEVTAASLVGALTGAVTAALVELLSGPARARQLLSDHPERLRAEMSRVTELALGPWRPQGAAGLGSAHGAQAGRRL
jgi:AcrR family transcriptional regulator